MQTLLVIIAIGLAVGYLGRIAYTRFFKKEAACDTCAFGQADSVLAQKKGA